MNNYYLNFPRLQNVEFILGHYIIGNLAMSATTVVLACVFLWLSHSKAPLPNWVKKIFLEGLGKVGLPKNNTDENEALEIAVGQIEEHTYDDIIKKGEYIEKAEQQRAGTLSPFENFLGFRAVGTNAAFQADEKEYPKFGTVFQQQIFNRKS